MDTPCSLQIVIDTEDAHVLADWWAETLGWEVEHQDEGFIRSMIEQGFATEADTVTHRGALVWAGAAAIGPPADGADGAAAPPGPGASGRPRILFQDVPEAKTVKNRIHLDLRPGPTEDVAAIRQRLLERGAVEVGGGQQGPHRWVTLADPEGNEFCLDC
ncbi:MAG: VOC family protein [Actinomycetota bacterium]